MIYVELLCLQLVTVFIVDLSGIVDTLKRAVWFLMKGTFKGFQDFRLKPLDCSLCMTFWGTLIYAICAGAFSMTVLLYCCALAYCTTLAKAALQTVRDAAAVLIDKIGQICGIY